MPKLSRFSPCGMLTLSSQPSHAEQIYKALVASQGDAYRDGKGQLNPRQEARLYAQAMGLARARYALLAAGNQQFARHAWDLLPVQEREHGLIPRPGETLGERRGALAARMLLPAGASQTNVENALRELLGDDFVAYRPTPASEAALYPANLGDQPMLLQPPEVARKLCRLEQVIATGLGAPQEVAYSDVLDPKPTATGAEVLAVGDRVLVEPENDALAEVVTVEAARVVIFSEIDDYQIRFTATFTKPHQAGAVLTTAPYPYWTSTKRHSLVVLTASAAADPETRRKVNELMSRLARGVSTWDIAAESAPGVAGPFRVGEGRLGITPMGTVAI